MDAGEAACPRDWPNSEVEDRKFPDGLSVLIMLLPSGDTSGEAPTAIRRADCWK